MGQARQRPTADGQVVEETAGEVRLVSMTSAYYVDETNRGDVVVNASFIGVWPARFMARHQPRALIGVDCGIGKDGAGIAGLWYLEALGIPALAAAVADVRLLDGADVLRNGVEEGMSVIEAARALMVNEPAEVDPHERGRRTVVAEHPSGRNVVCTHSIAFPLPEDRNHNVLCTGGFAGAPNIVKASAYGFVCSDGGRGRDDMGLDGLKAEIPGATVDVQTARIGDGLSTYYEGIISACNELAAARGVKIGQRAEEAAWLLVSGE
jgi:hypothetical protein